MFISPLNPEHVQKDGVAMGSPLGPVLAGISMIKLEKIHFYLTWPNI